jgi:hypothetical protein
MKFIFWLKRPAAKTLFKVKHMNLITSLLSYCSFLSTRRVPKINVINSYHFYKQCLQNRKKYNGQFEITLALNAV